MLKEPCLHEKDHVPTDQVVPDYHPLSYREMSDLVRLAFNDRSQANAVQVRLGQAIEGMVCPHEIDGPVAEKSVRLDSTFVDCIRNGDQDGAIAKIAAILDITPIKIVAPLKLKR